MREEEILGIIRKKVAEFSKIAPRVGVKFCSKKTYLDVVRNDPFVKAQVEIGVYGDLEKEFSQPIYYLPKENVMLVCTEIIQSRLAGEPAEIHRPFVEGLIIREILKLCVRSSGPEKEAAVDRIMKRNFAFQYAVLQALSDKA